MVELKKLNLSETDAFECIKNMQSNIERRLLDLGFLTAEIDYSSVVTISQLVNENPSNPRNRVYGHINNFWTHYEKIGCKKYKAGKIVLSYRALVEILHNFSDEPDIAKLFKVDEIKSEEPVLASGEVEVPEEKEMSDLDKLYLIRDNLQEKIEFLQGKLDHVDQTIDIIVNYEKARIEARNIITEHEGSK